MSKNTRRLCRFRSTSLLWVLTLLLAGNSQGARAQQLPELPRKISAWAAAGHFTEARTVAIVTANRDDKVPEPTRRLEQFLRAGERALQGTPLTVLRSASHPQLTLELGMAPSVGYGQFHYDTAPYDYLLLSDNKTGGVIYCAYERLMVFRSASSELLRDFRNILTGQAAPPDSANMRNCVEQAHAPLQWVIG